MGMKTRTVKQLHWSKKFREMLTMNYSFYVIPAGAQEGDTSCYRLTSAEILLRKDLLNEEAFETHHTGHYVLLLTK
jgi:hypothetical protein